jgi:3',5'-nucleoside bisphosphate phosphatase
VAGSPPTFDLQSHSVHSDGSLAAPAVVAAAAEAGVELLALTDHDTVAGIREAAQEAASDGRLQVVPAVEISTIDAGGRDLHVLGYLIDDLDPRLVARLGEARGARQRRAEAIAQALTELGFELNEDALRARLDSGQSVGRPHLAEAVVSHPANTARLRSEGTTDPSAFLEAYLIEGRPAFRPRTAPSVAEAIAMIHEAGGLAVWAHPFWDILSPQAVLDSVDRFRSYGLDGVECFYPTHGPEQVALLTERCERLGLLRTGSSDFHGPGHRQFSRFRAFSTYGHEPLLGPIAG